MLVWNAVTEIIHPEKNDLLWCFSGLFLRSWSLDISLFQSNGRECLFFCDKTCVGQVFVGWWKMVLQLTEKPFKKSNVVACSYPSLQLFQETQKLSTGQVITCKPQLNVKELSYVESSWAKCLCLSQGMCCRAAEQSLHSGECKAPSETSWSLKAEYKTKDLQLKNVTAWKQRVFTHPHSPEDFIHSPTYPDTLKHEDVCPGGMSRITWVWCRGYDAGCQVLDTSLSVFLIGDTKLVFGQTFCTL